MICYECLFICAICTFYIEHWKLLDLYQLSAGFYQNSIHIWKTLLNFWLFACFCCCFFFFFERPLCNKLFPIILYGDVVKVFTNFDSSALFVAYIVCMHACICIWLLTHIYYNIYIWWHQRAVSIYLLFQFIFYKVTLAIETKLTT